MPFLVITTTSSTGQDPTGAVVSRLRGELSGPVAAGCEIVNLSVSLGAAVLDVNKDMASAVAHAHAAMYADKRRRQASD